jgi:hypothetical protein
VPIKSIKYPVPMMCFATAEFSGWCRGIYLWCSLHLVLIVLPVCPTKTFPHPHGIWYAPGTFNFWSFLSVSVRFSCLGCFIEFSHREILPPKFRINMLLSFLGLKESDQIAEFSFETSAITSQWKT